MQTTPQTETLTLTCPICGTVTFEGPDTFRATDDPTCPKCNTPSLLAWCRDKSNWPAEEMRWEGAHKHQVLFVRDQLGPMVVWRDGMDYRERNAAIVVVGSHRSKSIDCPVYLLDAPWAQVVLRDNFHDWNVAVHSKVGPIDADLSGLVGDQHGGYLFWQGMDRFRAEPWPESKEHFGLCVGNDYTLYTTLFLLRREGMKHA